MIDFTNFQKPQRYIGNEWNVLTRTHSGKINVCLSYPDLYEIGMSNLGIRIIYGLLNQYPEIACERVFMPANDLLRFLKEKGEKLFSLESQRPLNEFEILGFHLGCELNFTNMLNILDLGGILLRAEERSETIVIGGGIANPEPLAEFIDLFLLGEFEEVAEQFTGVLKQYTNKEERLKAFAQIKGFYVPKFYSVSFKNNRYSFVKKYSLAMLPLNRVYLKDLDQGYYPAQWLTPHTQITHDRAQIEIARGCPNQCRFCQARALYWPYRQRSLVKIKQMIEEIYKWSGYEDFSLLSLSASDYSDIQGLIAEVWDYCKSRRIGLSLPSLRIDDILGPLYQQLSTLKKTSLTVAVEAPRDCLRKKLNKNCDINKLFEAARLIRKLGAKKLKLYFMFGFPDEAQEDLIAIGEFLNRLRRNSQIELNASINMFIPKPLSLWQSTIMDSLERLEAKRETIIGNIPKTSQIKFSLSSAKKTILEAIIARADRKFSKVIYRAYQLGARYDGHNEYFSWNIWEKSMSEEGVDYQTYLYQDRQNHPWSLISSENGSCK